MRTRPPATELLSPPVTVHSADHSRLTAEPDFEGVQILVRAAADRHGPAAPAGRRADGARRGFGSEEKDPVLGAISGSDPAGPATGGDGESAWKRGRRGVGVGGQVGSIRVKSAGSTGWFYLPPKCFVCLVFLDITPFFLFPLFLPRYLLGP